MRALLISWEYPGAHSPGGAALSRRVGQVARGLAAHGWDVDVAHRDHNNFRYSLAEPISEISNDSRPITLIGIGGHGIDPAGASGKTPALIRRLSTAYHAFRYGDRTGLWGSEAARILLNDAELRPHIVIAFFTPRGPLLAARKISDQLDIPWIADLQDSALEGSGPRLRTLVSHWMRRALRSAGAVVQVSPEWAREDAELLGREVGVMRHAVPDRAKPPVHNALRAERASIKVRLLYAGNINPDHQNPAPLMQAIDLVNGRALRAGGPTIELAVAAPDSTFQAFLTSATSDVARSALHSLGWLSEESLLQSMLESDALIVVPWASADRLVVPSKLFEYFSTGIPILLAGPDSGGIRSLLAEWAHPALEHDTSEQIASAFLKLSTGDLSGVLHSSRCGKRPFSERDLAARYSELAERLVLEKKSRN